MDLAVGPLGDLGELLLGRLVGAVEVVELLDRHPRGDLAGTRAAHPVGHHEQRRALEERVLVALALAPNVAERRLLDDSKAHSYSW